MNNQNKHLQNGVQQRPVRDASTMENQSGEWNTKCNQSFEWGFSSDNMFLFLELKKNKDILIVEGITYDHRVNDVN